MKATEFCYWLQGYFEITEAGSIGNHGYPQGLSMTQVGMIKRHLEMVFKHDIDPSYPNQHLLNQIHNAVKPASYCAPDSGASSQQYPEGEVIRC